MFYFLPDDFDLLDQYLLQQKRIIIHQVWFGTIPNRFKASKTYKELKHCRESWDILNPNLCHTIWNKSNSISLIKKHYPEFYELFQSYPWEIQRCDMVRYCILHRYGGLYVDMDYKCKKDFSAVFQKYSQYDVYLVTTPNALSTDTVSNSLMLSYQKNHMFWKMLLLEMNKAFDKSSHPSSKHIEVMYTTGPGILSRVYGVYKYRYKISSLPSEYFHPLSLTKKFLEDHELRDVYAIHLGTGTWEASDSKILIMLYMNWKIILFILIIMLVPQFLVKQFAKV